jgi:hypothetical protein
LSYKWNIYKVFNNGKRAKAPFRSFKYKDPETVEEYFETRIKINFTDKLRRSKFALIRSDLPQNREEEKIDEKKKLHEQNKMRVFRKHFKTVDKRKIRNTHMGGGLILCKETGWKWQWAFIEITTSRYLTSLSSSFKTYSDALKWMEEEISTL